MQDKKHIDFISSLVCGVLGVYVVIESIRMYFDSGEVFYYSPGLTPFVLGCLLAVCSVMLFFRSIQGGGVKENISGAAGGGAAFLKSQTFRNALVGLVMMGVYAFWLLKALGFIVSTLLFLVAMMLFLKVGNIVKILAISGAVVAVTYIVFQIIFGVPLP